MADVAKRLGAINNPDATARTCYTVPANTTTIVRNIHCAMVINSAASASLFLSIGAFSAATALYYSYPIALGGALDWSGFLVLTAGEIMQVKTDSPGALTLIMSGIEVS